MIKNKTHLPTKRLFNFFERTGVFGYYSHIKHIRSGNKLSRVLRHIFEAKKIKSLIGIPFAGLILTASFFPTYQNIPEDTNEARIISIKETILNTDRVLRLPVDNLSITQYFSVLHPGIDFDGVTGDNIYSIMKGVVKDVSYSRFAYGNAVLIEHENNIESLYAHLSKIFVVKGQTIDTFTILGEMGATGRATGDHLHFELRQNGFPVNPASIFNFQELANLQ